MTRQKIFATRMKIKRKEKKISQQQLADRLGITRQAITAYECCINEPTLSTICSIASVLGVDANYLFGYEDIDNRKVIEIKCSDDFQIITSNIKEV